MIKTYSELILLPTFEERLKYLQTYSHVGEDTFGSARYLNQSFYRSSEWRKIRDKVIMRDLGCDLGIVGREISRHAIIHHLNPITERDLIEITPYLIDPEFLITTTHKTHNLIHYGGEEACEILDVERRPNDTCPWR